MAALINSPWEREGPVTGETQVHAESQRIDSLEFNVVLFLYAGLQTLLLLLLLLLFCALPLFFQTVPRLNRNEVRVRSCFLELFFLLVKHFLDKLSIIFPFPTFLLERKAKSNDGFSISLSLGYTS